MKTTLTRVEAIVHDDLLTNQRDAVIEDYEEFILDDNFYNDIEHNEIICSVDDLKRAIKEMNAEKNDPAFAILIKTNTTEYYYCGLSEPSKDGADAIIYSSEDEARLEFSLIEETLKEKGWNDFVLATEDRGL